MIFAGLLLGMTNLAWLGVLIFAGGAVFSLATLPVEFNASSRAKQLLAQTGIIQTDEEMRGVNAVLNASALTYVAALVTELTPELVQEGLAREFVRRVQDLRKSADLDVADRIELFVEASAGLRSAIEAMPGEAR